MADEKSPSSYDVLIIGAGISGINTACRLHQQAPDRTYAIIEARNSIGGTWDLFKYPGIRSDSDLHTFGFPFRPWTKQNAIADGASIKQYMQDTAAEYGVDKHILYHHKLVAANWSTDEKRWNLEIDSQGNKRQFKAKFLMLCTGYYDYNEGLQTNIPGIENFQGQVVHPQFWPENLDYKDKNIVIIGSGATAITLLPSLAQGGAEHVTMLQRSPTYIVALSQVGGLAYWAHRLLPTAWAFAIIRLQFLILPILFFKFCRTFPAAARRSLEKGAIAQLPEGYPISPNFKPYYNPWDQRLCFCPNGDFFEALRDDKASVITANVKEITEKSIHLEESGQVLHPDIIVTATGLKLVVAGGVKITVDGEPVNVPDKHVWKGVMLEDVPNAAFVFGYVNASWTLGADTTAQFVARLLNKMKDENITQAVPKVDKQAGIRDVPLLNLKSTYVRASQGTMPKSGDRAPWLRRTYYFKDLWEAKHGDLTKEMHYTRAAA